MNRLPVMVLGGIFLFSFGATLLAEEEKEWKKEIEALRKEVTELREQMYAEDEKRRKGGVIEAPGLERLKISGEIRIREEYKKHLYSPTDPGGDERFDFAHMRTRLRFDADVVKDISAVVELQDVRIIGSPTTSIDDGVDLKRGEMIFTNLFVDDLTLEVGRYVMFYGDQRLIGHLEWFDQGRTYDGVRLSLDPEGWFADLFGVRLDDDANFNDDDSDFIGIYGGVDAVIPHLGVEGYILHRRDQNHLAGMDNTRFFTYGIRAFGNRDGFDYTGELAFQRGDVIDKDLRAKAFALTGGYTFEESSWTPRVGVEIDYASGEQNPLDDDTEQFQTLFPTNHLHYGYADLVGWSNMWDYRFGVSVRPRDDLTLTADWHHFLLDDADGGWINAGGAQVRGGQPGASKHLGEELDLTAKWTPTKPLSLLAGWSHFFPGGFVDDTGRDRSADFLYLQARLVF